jgi:invasion protein IalB
LKNTENICHLTNQVIDENNNQNTLAVYVSKVKKAIFCQLDEYV